MCYPSTVIVFFLVNLLAVGAVWADLVAPQVADAWRRHESNPKAFDQTDQYCHDLKSGSACVIPGTAFEGGGAGLCAPSVSDKSQYISLVCNLRDRIEIDHQIPDGPFRVNESVCLGDQQNPKYTCSEPPLRRDRFCTKAQSGQSCIAEILINGKKSSQSGTCQVSEQLHSFYFRGQQTARRQVLMCAPVKPAPARVFTPVSQWKKLLQ
jgi:hypothetical protein